MLNGSTVGGRNPWRHANDFDGVMFAILLPAGIAAKTGIDRVLEGEAVGIRIDSLEGSAFDDTVEGMQRFTFINNSRRVRAVEAGTIHGIEIDRVRGSWRELPLTVHVHDSMCIDDAINSEVSTILVHTLGSVACPWRVSASVAIKRLVNSHYCGVVVEEYKAEPKSG